MTLGFLLKKLLNRIGYDIKRHHPFYETVVEPLHIKTILDIGANTGAYAKEMAMRFPHAHIISFEPLTDCFKKLERTSEKYSTITPLRYALGDISGTSVIKRSSFHPSSSLRPMSTLHKTLYPKSAGVSEEIIEIKRLDDVASALDIREPFIVKMDVQGFEDAVIRGGATTLKNAALLIVETSFFPLYENQPLFDDVASQLNELGFSYYGALHTHHSRKTGRALYEDSIFLSRKTQNAFLDAESTHR